MPSSPSAPSFPRPAWWLAPSAPITVTDTEGGVEDPRVIPAEREHQRALVRELIALLAHTRDAVDDLARLANRAVHERDGARALIEELAAKCGRYRVARAEIAEGSYSDTLSHDRARRVLGLADDALECCGGAEHESDCPVQLEREASWDAESKSDADRDER